MIENTDKRHAGDTPAATAGASDSCRAWGSLLLTRRSPETVPGRGEIPDKKLENKTGALLLNFIKEMHDWEIFCNEIIENKELTFEEKYEKQKEKCQIIFEKYCPPKERKYGRPNCISSGSEGSFIYDGNIEKIIKMKQEKENRILVYTNGDDVVEQYMYVILKKNGDWLIDSKKIKFIDEEKFENTYL
jgi:hypothetical protein